MILQLIRRPILLIINDNRYNMAIDLDQGGKRDQQWLCQLCEENGPPKLLWDLKLPTIP